MPLYEYICFKCKSRFELLRQMSRANEEVLCPDCHSRAKKILSNFACVSKDESGISSPIGGSPCSSCSTSSCDTCGN
ncbi:MAG: zinc ribbon domain-containing protein [Dehalococcoidia bacterium]|nr:MAG: zinc ribbon domain-containing protein [Dehalococcoidia bacterium]